MARLQNMSSTAADPAYESNGEKINPRLLDGVLAAAVTVIIMVVVAADLERTGRAGPLAYTFAVGFGVILLARRRAPRLVLVLTVLGIFLYYPFQLPPIGLALPAAAALYSAAEAGCTRSAIATGGVLVSVSAYARIRDGLPTDFLYSYEMLTNIALVAAAIALGVSVRSRREIRSHQEKLRALTAARERQDAEVRLHAEMAGIARDLHDTIGHTLSVIAVHSNVASEAVGRNDDAVMRAIEQIQAANSATLRELRNTVKVLRGPETESTERSGIGMTSISQLVSQVRNTGVNVTAHIDLSPGDLDATIDAAAFRIAQEALTNVMRHSAAAEVTVEALLRDDALELTVTDDGQGVTDSRSQESRGRGLRGMSERANLLGGNVTVGNRIEGGFQVRATLPRRLNT